MDNSSTNLSYLNDNISYIYDASGTKWLKVYDGLLNENTMFAGSFVYKSDGSTNYSLDYLLNEEGMVDMNGSTLLSYEYFLKDHLGNTRVVLDDQGNVDQRSDYYPFGMRFNFTDYGIDNKYLYNGKELQDDQLGGVNLDLYDYGARFYDPAIGRFHSIDPKTEIYNFQTPYSYAVNNPILFIDKKGEGPEIAALIAANPVAAATVTAGAVLLTVLVVKMAQESRKSGFLHADMLFEDNPGYKNQQKNERLAKEKAAQQQLQGQKDIENNYPSPSPEGGGEPNGGGSIFAKVVIGTGLAIEGTRGWIENVTPDIESVTNYNGDATSSKISQGAIEEGENISNILSGSNDAVEVAPADNTNLMQPFLPIEKEY